MDIQQKLSFFDRLFGGYTYNNSTYPRRRQPNGLFHMMWGKSRRDRIIINPDLFWDSSEDSDEYEDEDDEEDDDDDDDDNNDGGNYSNKHNNEENYFTMTKSPSSSSSSSVLSRGTRKTDVQRIIRRSKSHHNKKSNNINPLPTKTGTGEIIQHQQHRDHDSEYANRVYAATLNKLQNPPHNLRVSAALWYTLNKSLSASNSVITGSDTLKSKKQQRQQQHQQQQQQQQQQLHEKLLPPLLTENPTGKRKVSCRYFIMLLETPVHQVRQNRHPIHEAVDRHRPRFQDVTIVTTARLYPSFSSPKSNSNTNNSNNTSTSSSPAPSSRIAVIKKAKSFPSYWKRQREQRKKPIIKCATTTIAEEIKERRKREMLNNNNNNNNSNVPFSALSLSSSLSSSSTTTTASSSTSLSSTPSCAATNATSFSSPVRCRSDGMTIEDDDQDDVPLGLLRKTPIDNI